MYKDLPKGFSILCDVRSTIAINTSPMHLYWFKMAAKANTYQILWDEFERPIGYVLWANICKESLFRIQRTGIYPQHHYEWSEGKIKLILDIAINDLNRVDALHQIKSLMKKQKIVAYTKKSIGKLHIKQKHRLSPKGQQNFAELAIS